MSSSSSDYSHSDESSSDSDVEAFIEQEEEEEPQQQGEGEEEEEEEQVAKKCKKISSTSTADNEKVVQQVPPLFSHKEKPALPLPAVRALAAAAAAAAPRPCMMGLKAAKVSPLPSSTTATNRLVRESQGRNAATVAPPPFHQRSASLLTATRALLTSDTSTMAHHHQQHRLLGVNTATMTPAAGETLIHEISMQPWELSRSRGARAVSDAAATTVESEFTSPESTGIIIGNCNPKSNPVASSGVATSQMLDDDASMGAMDVSVTAMDVSMDITAEADCAGGPPQNGAVSATAPVSSSSAFGASLLTQAGFFGALEDIDLECPHWAAPSLTREMSLARAVDALEGEHLAHGVGFEGSFSTGW